MITSASLNRNALRGALALVYAFQRGFAACAATRLKEGIDRGADYDDEHGG
jgi:hypothetical protein